MRHLREPGSSSDGSAVSSIWGCETGVEPVAGPVARGLIDDARGNPDDSGRGEPMSTSEVTRFDDLAYPIVIGAGLAPEVAALVRERGFARTVVLCDRNAATYARRVGRAIPGAKAVAFALGERRKIQLRSLELVVDALVPHCTPIARRW